MASKHFMRLSLRKGAHADLSWTAYRKSGCGTGTLRVILPSTDVLGYFQPSLRDYCAQDQIQASG